MKKIITHPLLCFLTACSSTTIIRSSDPEAQIFINGSYQGKGVIAHTDSKPLWSRTQVRIEKQGCEPATHILRRNEELDVGALVGGIFLLVPLLWVQKYKAEHFYDFNCAPPSATTSVNQ